MPTRTFELMQMATLTREDKRTLAYRLGLKSDTSIYQYCEDPRGSGRPNPIDKLQVVFEFALEKYPDAALAILQHFTSLADLRISGRDRPASPAELVTALQPGSEKEALEAVRAFSAALVQGITTGDCDLPALLREVQEAERAMRRAAVMIQAAVADAKQV